MTTAIQIVHNASSGPKKDYVNRIRMMEPKTGVLFVNFIDKVVSRRKKRKSASYEKNYKILIRHINEFSDKNNAVLYTNSINEDFMDDFVTYLEEMNLKNNYIKMLVDLIRAMGNKAALNGYATDPSYNDIDVDTDERSNTYLSMNQISRIYYFAGLTRKQEVVRDLFVVGCLTALRYSDYSTLSELDFHGDFIVKVTKKTGIKVVIPLHDFVRDIFEKYDHKIPCCMSIQNFNRQLKVICKKIGLNDPVVFTERRGGKVATVQRFLWEEISSHTARRSAATNMYLTGRMKTYEIMAITGHTTEKSFFRYICLNNMNKAKQIAGDVYFKK